MLRLCAPGNNQQNIPTAPEKTTEPKIASLEMSVGQPNSFGIASERTIPNTMPMKLPVRLSTIDSMRNWLRTADERAPMAIRMPISRVRSVTETSRMFIIPMPPTSSETLSMHASSIVMVLLVSLAASARGQEQEAVGKWTVQAPLIYKSGREVYSRSSANGATGYLSFNLQFHRANLSVFS